MKANDKFLGVRWNDPKCWRMAIGITIIQLFGSMPFLIGGHASWVLLLIPLTVPFNYFFNWVLDHPYADPPEKKEK